MKLFLLVCLYLLLLSLQTKINMLLFYLVKNFLIGWPMLKYKVLLFMVEKILIQYLNKIDSAGYMDFYIYGAKPGRILYV